MSVHCVVLLIRPRFHKYSLKWKKASTIYKQIWNHNYLTDQQKSVAIEKLLLTKIEVFCGGNVGHSFGCLLWDANWKWLLVKMIALGVLYLYFLLLLSYFCFIMWKKKKNTHIISSADLKELWKCGDSKIFNSSFNWRVRVCVYPEVVERCWRQKKFVKMCSVSGSSCLSSIKKNHILPLTA